MQTLVEAKMTLVEPLPIFPSVPRILRYTSQWIIFYQEKKIKLNFKQAIPQRSGKQRKGKKENDDLQREFMKYVAVIHQ